MSDAIQQWVDQAQYDLETARAMLKSGRYLYVLFCCQQATEKALKAIIAKQTRKLPPRLHDLIEPANRAGIERDEKQDLLMRSLSECYKKTQYPDIMDAASRGVSAEIARDYLSQTEPIIQWLSSMM
ncbi:MAG TPA: HEPN domain-containing protein [bacterium]|nr:HEPN domain-containing protein [bacterium]HQO36217.1 HEPN domain-containing protein [bacterium]